jgi:hypothetical protein
MKPLFLPILPLTKNQIKGGISGQSDKTKVINGTKLGNQEKFQSNRSVHERENVRMRPVSHF